MASSRISALAALLSVATACGLEPNPEVVERVGRGLGPVVLVPSGEESAAGERWEFAEVPAASREAEIDERFGTVVLVPDVRGGYVVERSLELGVSSELAQRFLVRVPGLPGQPSITAAPRAAVGATAIADGTASVSPEGRPLSFQWRLARRPRDSAATLDDDLAPQTSFVADVPGEFVVALSVYDGQLWSEEIAATIEVVP